MTPVGHRVQGCEGGSLCSRLGAVQRVNTKNASLLNNKHSAIVSDRLRVHRDGC